MTSDLDLLRRSVKDPVTGQQLKDDARPDLYAADARRIADALETAQEEIERLQREVSDLRDFVKGQARNALTMLKDD